MRGDKDVKPATTGAGKGRQFALNKIQIWLSQFHHAAINTTNITERAHWTWPIIDIKSHGGSGGGFLSALSISCSAKDNEQTFSKMKSQQITFPSFQAKRRRGKSQVFLEYLLISSCYGIKLLPIVPHLLNTLWVCTQSTHNVRNLNITFCWGKITNFSYILFLKGANLDFYFLFHFFFFSNVWRFLYHKKAHIFLITRGTFQSWKVFHLKYVNENMPSYGNWD